jgi:hypothetical protein
VQGLYGLETSAWRLGNLFFGLWLIPMGWAAKSTDYVGGIPERNPTDVNYRFLPTRPTQRPFRARSQTIRTHALMV